MTSPMKPGPWKTLSGEGGTSVPFYVIPFDKNGVCMGPLSLDHLVDAAAEVTDVFLFSHGWNNDWSVATNRYDDFIGRFAEVRHLQWSPPSRDYRPVLVGVFWPSTALVAPWEAGPGIAAGSEPGVSQVSGTPQDFAEMNVLADNLSTADAERFYELAQSDHLDKAGAAELAAILAPTLGIEDDELEQQAAPPTRDELLEVWASLPADAKTTASQPELGGFIDEGATTKVETAGLVDFLDPRKIVRSATVLLMKDRAGRVGGAGVAVMLRRLIGASPDSRIHLVGHSYGAKVVLSALCNGPPPSRNVDSVLLLQPAMSCLCFAAKVDQQGHQGGYRPALDRSRQPIMTTYSSRDVPLTKLFHWAVRRTSDLGEAVIAGAPPSKYAALGGFGPHGVDEDVVTVTAKRLPDRYSLRDVGRRIIAVDANDAIKGHGDVTNQVTAWALLNQVMG